MKRFGQVLLACATMTSSPSAAGPVDGGSTELFLRCSDLFRQESGLKAELEDLTRRAGPLMTEQHQLRSEVKRHEAEYKRLEKIADIMRSSDDVRRKFNRAVRRYHEAFDRFKPIQDRVRKLARIFEARQREQEAVSGRRRAECIGTWNRAVLDRICGSGERKHGKFCASFAGYDRDRRPRDIDDCESQEPDRRIRGCSRLIKSGTLNAKALSGVYSRRGSAYRKTGQYDRAIADYDRAIELDPRALLYNNRGYAYQNKGQYARAIADYDRALELDPQFERARANRRSLLAAKKKRKQVARSKPKFTIRAPLTPCDKLAAHSDDPGRVVEGVPFDDIKGTQAVRDCKAAVAIFPDAGRFHAYLSRAYDKVGDNELSMKHALRSAELGYPFGYHYVSLHYTHGMGVPQDDKKEFEWRTKAALKGLPVGIYSVGVAYRKGDGTTKDLRRAAKWLQKAAEVGYARAHWQLGLVHEEGIDGKPDLVSAASHHQMAIEKGIESARKALARVRAKQAN